MKILITGGNGFIGRNLIKALQKDHQIFSPSSSELDLTNSDKVDKYLRNKYFDFVIHCAIKGGRRTKEDSPYVTYDNLKMFFNLLKNKDRFRYLINFASGAEFDRRTEVNSTTNSLLDSYPIDYYGMSKNIISRIIENSIEDCYNFRVYGVFGVDEQDNRFIKKSILNCKKGEPIVVHQDRFFDYFYIKDLVNVIKYWVENPVSQLESTIDLVYQTKHKLSDIAKIINNISSNKSKIIIGDQNKGLAYTGNNIGINVNFDLVGLEEGIKQVYNEL